MNAESMAALDDAITRFRFRLDGIGQRFEDWFDGIKTRIEGMLSVERGPEDYERTQNVAVSGSHNHLGHDWRKRRNAVVDALLAAGIIAAATASITNLVVTGRLDERLTERSRQYDREFSRVDRDNDRQDAYIQRDSERITALEREQRQSLANPHR